MKEELCYATKLSLATLFSKTVNKVENLFNELDELTNKIPTISLY